MKKKAKDLKKGENIKIAGKICEILDLETSEVAGKAAMRGKQGGRKVRIEAKTEDGEKVTIIRPEGYPFEVQD